MLIKRLLIALFLLFPGKGFAADSTVAALAAASALAGSELFYCVQSSADKKCTASQLSTFILTAPNIGVATATSINFGGATLSTYTATTWTPTITTTGTVGTPAYSVQVGSYEQIGRQVTVRFNIQLSGWTGSPTGNVAIGGLPVAAAATANDQGFCTIAVYTVAGLAALNYGLTGFIDPSATTARLVQNGNTTSGSLTAAQAGTTPLFSGMCNYHT